VTLRLAALQSRLRLALRAVYPAPEGSRERVRARLAVALASLDAGSAPSQRAASTDPVQVLSGPKAKAVAKLGSSAIGAGKLAALALLGGMAGAAVLATIEARRPARVVYVDHAPAQVAASATVARPAAGASFVEPSGTSSASTDSPTAAASVGRSATVEASASRSATAEASRRPRGGPASGASSFAAERALLDQARGALVQGEPRRAMLLLVRHRTRFPSGALAEERDAMTIEALVAESRYGEARAMAQAFRARNPRSLFLGAVDSAIESIP